MQTHRKLGQSAFLDHKTQNVSMRLSTSCAIFYYCIFTFFSSFLQKKLKILFLKIRLSNFLSCCSCCASGVSGFLGQSFTETGIWTMKAAAAAGNRFFFFLCGKLSVGRAPGFPDCGEEERKQTEDAFFYFLQQSHGQLDFKWSIWKQRAQRSMH